MNKGAVITMMGIGALLLGFGTWQFGALPLAGGEGDGDHDRRHDADVPELNAADRATLMRRISDEYGTAVIEVEQERKDGRSVLELKLGDGREVLLDPASGEVIRIH